MPSNLLFMPSALGFKWFSCKGVCMTGTCIQNVLGPAGFQCISVDHFSHSVGKNISFHNHLLSLTTKPRSEWLNN